MIMGQNGKIDWASVDWSQQDVVLAGKLGVSRERVRQVRPKGMAASTPRKRRGVTAVQRLAMMDVSGKTLEEVARAAGCSQWYARTALRSLGKPYRKARKDAKYDWGLFPEGWRAMTDKEIATIVGVPNPTVVTVWRLRRGLRRVELPPGGGL